MTLLYNYGIIETSIRGALPRKKKELKKMKTIVNSCGVELNWEYLEQHILCEIDNLAERFESTQSQIFYDLEKRYWDALPDSISEDSQVFFNTFCAYYLDLTGDEWYFDGAHIQY